MNNNNDSNNFLESLKKQLQGLTSAFIIFQILASVVLPICEGILASIISNQDNFGAFHWTLILFAIIHLIIVFILLKNEKPLPQFFLEFEKQKKKISELENLSEIYNDYNETFMASLTATELSLIGINERIFDSKEQLDINTICKIILDPWITDRSSILNFVNGNSMYNIAVYTLNKESNLLELDFRKNDDRIQTKNRKWKPGVGHVGQCFSTEQTIFCRDIEDNIKTTNKESSRKEDKDYYRSIIAEPIKSDQQVIGVVVITSSQPEQFDDSIHTIIIRIIALLLETGYSNIKELNKNENH